MPAQTTAGEKTINVTLKYTLNNVAKISVRTTSITIADVVEPTLSIAMSSLTPADPKDGATVTYNMDCTVTKNDAATLTSLVVEDDSTALVGTETFTSTNVVEGLNTIACTPTATKTANTYTVKVTLNYTINGTNKTLVETLTYEVKAKTLATTAYHGMIPYVKLGIPNNSGSLAVMDALTPELIKALPSVDPFTGFSEDVTANLAKANVHCWPTHLGYNKIKYTDAGGADITKTKDTVTISSKDIDGTPYTVVTTLMTGATITVNVSK